MARVITFSRQYPAYHPKAGEPTYFVEKIWKALWEANKTRHNPVDGYWQQYDEAFPCQYVEGEDIHTHTPKLHTIRSGNRWKAGDWFSPRVWTGKPYNSKMLQFAPDMQVKKTIRVYCDGMLWWVNNQPAATHIMEKVAGNDGLLHTDLLDWFRWPYKPFKGQIICWDENVSY